MCRGRDLLRLDDADLLRQCDVETMRGSGRGGQKRNKTETAVRIRHRPTGVAAQSDATRSQHQNRRVALERLRARIALELRDALDPATHRPSPELIRLVTAGVRRLGRRPEDASAVAELLDLLAALGGSVRDAARAVGLSTGRLSRFLTSEPRLHRAVNSLRAERGLGPLR